MNDKRLVYSNDPKDQEKVFSKNKKPLASNENVVPQNIYLKLRLESKSRGGKSVSLIYDLTVQNQKYWEDLTKKLKNHCACGGSYKKDSNTIEIQGDQRSKLKVFLEKLGFKVKP